MTVTLQPIIATPDLDRLARFYVELFGATEFQRVPGDGGSTFYLGLQVGDSELGLVSDANVQTGGSAQRMLLSVDVADVDSLLERVEALGGSAPSAPNDMPWGQRVAHVEDPDGNTVNLTQQI